MLVFCKNLNVLIINMFHSVPGVPRKSGTLPVPAGAVKDDPATMFVVCKKLFAKDNTMPVNRSAKVHPPQDPLCEALRKR